MKKKFIAVYALIGVLALGSTTLTSCVDDNESPSVTAIRDAKAAQLNALATLSTEQANAAKIQAEAEAAIKNAIAAYYDAVAVQEDVKAQIAKGTLSVKLEAAQAAAEADLMSQKAALETAKAKLIAEMDAVADEQKASAVAIIGKMDELTKSIHNKTTQLIDFKFKKADAEYELENDSILLAQEINENNAEIAVQEALIVEYQKYSQEDKQKAEEAATAAEQELTVLYEQSQQLQSEYSVAQEKTRQAYDKLAATPFMTNVSASYLTDEETPESEDYVIDYGDGTISKGSIVYRKKFTIDTEKVATLDDDIADAENDVKVFTLKLAEAEKALADKKETQAYKDAVANVDAKLKAYNEATESTAKDNAWDAYQRALNELANVTSSEESGVETAQNDKKSREDRLDLLNKTKAYINDTSAYDAYSKLYDEYVAARKAENDAWIALNKADHNYSVKYLLSICLRIVANGTTDYAQLIDECNTQINTIKQDNDQLKAVADQNELIAYYDSKINSLDAQIKAENALYAQYEAALNQVIEGKTPEVPDTPATDTPAEGEETPAE